MTSEQIKEAVLSERSQARDALIENLVRSFRASLERVFDEGQIVGRQALLDELATSFRIMGSANSGETAVREIRTSPDGAAGRTRAREWGGLMKAIRSAVRPGEALSAKEIAARVGTTPGCVTVYLNTAARHGNPLLRKVAPGRYGAANGAAN
jgi:hypothetical protein